MSERVLPLRAIAVFEAVARAASFHAAAHELNLTPSAVSHQIRQLEDTLGVRLFDRVGRGVKLTPDGAQYARSVRQSMRRLRLATSDIKARGSRAGTLAVVRIETPPTFAHCWLLPRLPALIAQHSGIELRVNAQGAHLQGDRLPWTPAADAPADIQIVYGGDDLWEDRATRLSSEVFQPYCAPSLQNRDALESPHQLLQHTLISSAQNHVSWDDWMESQGIDMYESTVGTMQLDPSHLAIEAAVNGLGVILENGILVERQLSSGSLVAPFPELSALGLSYWILTRSSRRARPAVDAVLDWLQENASSPSKR